MDYTQTLEYIHSLGNFKLPAGLERITEALKRLENKNLVEIFPDPKNKSKNIVKITEKGKEVTKEFVKIINQIEDEIFSEYTNEEIYSGDSSGRQRNKSCF